jgi:hypothetical protein
MTGISATGCEGRFVDPYPAELERLQRSHVVQVQPAPVVYGLVFDLYLADATECTRVQQLLRTRMRSAMGTAARELAAQDLSPGCSATPGSRRFDTAAYAAAFEAAQQQLGRGRVRPVLLYFNNLALPMPESLRFDLQTLRSGGSAPLIWALTLQSTTRTDLPFDVSHTWTHSADPALSAPLEASARQLLPLDQLMPGPEGFPVFTPAEQAGIRAFKACSGNGQVFGLNFTFGPQSTTVSAANPPRVTVTLATTRPEARGSVQPLTVRYEVEVCRAHCERSYEPPDGLPVIWSTTSGCLLKAES